MNVEKRILLCRIVEKVDKNKLYADRIGTKDKSKFDSKRKETSGR